MLQEKWVTFKRLHSAEEAEKWQQAFDREGIRYRLEIYNDSARAAAGIPLNRGTPPLQRVTSTDFNHLESYTFRIHRNDLDRAAKLNP